jgi:hypothetical protein
MQPKKSKALPDKFPLQGGEGCARDVIETGASPAGKWAHSEAFPW